MHVRGIFLGSARPGGIWRRKSLTWPNSVFSRDILNAPARACACVCARTRICVRNRTIDTDLDLDLNLDLVGRRELEEGGNN